jgi:hypothetical protein
MIVYTGKQFWNDFNNGDEWLFQDANRPRDNDKFKIRPWLQSDKWKQRSVNKDITTVASQLIAGWTTSGVAAASTMPEGCTIPKLSSSLKRGDPWCILKDWSVEITEDGTYIVQAMTQFIPASTPSSAYQYVEEVCLLRHKTWNYTGFDRDMITLNQARMCGKWDEVVAQWTWRFTKGTVLNVWAIHTYYKSITMYQRLNIQRLQ